MILLILLIITFAAAILTMHITKSNPLFAFGFVAALASLIILISCAWGSLTIDGEREATRQEYESITMYNTVVEQSYNAELRQYHQERVQEWNEKYTEYEKERKNIFLGLLFRPNIYKDCNLIDFIY